MLDSTAVVMFSFDHEASSLPEIRPLAEAVLHHCFSRGARVVGLALFAEGTTIGSEILRGVAAQHDKQYGTDYVYFGYRPQYAAAILGMGEAISEVFPVDYAGTGYDELPLLRRMHNYGQITLVITVADGSMPTYWVEYAQARYGVRVVAVLTGSMVTAYKPYLSGETQGQLAGIVGGLKGAAEYEKLSGVPGKAMRGMDAQSTTHVAIAGLIVLGNVVAWFGRSGRTARRGEKRR